MDKKPRVVEIKFNRKKLVLALFVVLTILFVIKFQDQISCLLNYDLCMSGIEDSADKFMPF